LTRGQESEETVLPIIELTADVNTILAGRIDQRQISPEKIGWILRSLDIHTQFITGGRKGILLTKAARTKIRVLAEGYGVRMLQAEAAEALKKFKAREELRS
jgi:hypothetical protein